MNSIYLKQCFDTNSDYYKKMMEIVERNKSLLKVKTAGRHLHHIIPKSFFKKNGLPVDNSPDNLVSLTPYEHCEIHFYVYCCCCGGMKRSAAYTLHLMYNLAEKSMGEKYLSQFAEMYEEATKLLGHKQTRATRQKMAAAKIGRPSNNSKKVLCSENGTTYTTAVMASKAVSREYNVKISNVDISLVCNGKKESIHGLHFRYI